MDQRRANTITSLLLLIIVVVCIFGIGRYYVVTRTLERIQAEDAQRVIGSDRTLLETVQNLENTLSERISYQFVSKEDPLDLSKVITSPEFLRKLGADKRDPDARVMRLAATVVGDEGGAAVIRYLGIGHVLRVGDELEGWAVSRIDKEKVTMRQGGRTRVLEVQPVRESLQQTGMMLSVRPMKNEQWMQNYSNTGFPGDIAEPDVVEEPAEPATDQPEDGAEAPAPEEAPEDTTNAGGNL